MHRGTSLVLHTLRLLFYITSPVIPELAHGNMLRSMEYRPIFLYQKREICSSDLARVS